MSASNAEPASDTQAPAKALSPAGAAPTAAPEPVPADGHGHAPTHGGTAALVLGAIGVVFGDIGTSPLYTIQECVGGPHGVSATPANVLGILSLIFWSLTMVVTVKYLAFVMRADNQGEGGILALLALVPRRFSASVGGRVGLISLFVIAGAALLFGDGIITPAISVLSAMEGLAVATDRLAPVVVPATCVILAMLFSVQRVGTGAVGRVFGPIMVLWFGTIAVLGARHAFAHPRVFSAIWPGYAVDFLAHHGFHAFRLLGSVVLAVTGGEALYADMGHFGRKPIRVAWLALILPALVLCYFGQGAVLLANPAAAAQPFFSMVPRGAWTFALVGIAAPATVIASQALISGVFSLTHQAVRLGYFPRVDVRHTASDAEGQIYVPLLNWMLAVSCIVLVLVFRQSSRLAAAFGLAVSGTMAITSVVFYVVTRHTWGWSPAKSLALLCLFLTFDLPFLGANLLKFFDGGYLPLAVGSVFFVAMVLWRRGRSLLADHYARMAMPLDEFRSLMRDASVERAPGAAVLMSSSAQGMPPTLVHMARRLRAIPEKIVLFTVTTEHTPFVADDARVSVETLGGGFFRVVARYGFMEKPRVLEAIARATEKHGLEVDPAELTYVLGRETFVAGNLGRMGPAAESIFALLSRNARNATLYYGVPPGRVVEVGMQIDL